MQIQINNVTVTVPLTITKKTSAEAYAQVLANRIPPTTKNYLNAVNVSVDDLEGSGPTYDASNDDVTNAINRGLQTLSNNVITKNDIKNISYTGNLVAGATELINGFIR